MISFKYCLDLHIVTMLKLPEKMILSIILLRGLARQEKQKEGNLVPLQRSRNCSHDRDRIKSILLIIKVSWKHAKMHVE